MFIQITRSKFQAGSIQEDTGIRGDTKEVLRGLVKRWENWTEYSMSTVNKLLPVLSDTEISQIVSSRIESFDLYGSLLEGGKLVVIDVSKTVHSEQQGRDNLTYLWI